MLPEIIGEKGQVARDRLHALGHFADNLRGLGRRCDAGTSTLHGWANSPAEGNGVTIRIHYRILNARLAAGAVSGGGVDQALRQFEFQQWVGSGYSFKQTPLPNLASL